MKINLRFTNRLDLSEIYFLQVDWAGNPLQRKPMGKPIHSLLCCGCRLPDLDTLISFSGRPPRISLPMGP